MASEGRKDRSSHSNTILSGNEKKLFNLMTDPLVPAKKTQTIAGIKITRSGGPTRAVIYSYQDTSS